MVSRLLALGKRLYVFLRLESIYIFLFPGLLCLIRTGMFEVVIVPEIKSISFCTKITPILYLCEGVWCFQSNHATLTSSPDVNLQEESFLDALPTDERLKKVRIIVVNVPCSKSGIVNPVDFVLQEGVTSSFKELARGNADKSKVKGLAFQHLSFLRHAMKFPQAQAIVYVTRSTHESENEDVVKKAMEMNQDERSKQTSFYELTPALPRLAQSLKEAGRVSNGLQKEISLTPEGK